MTVDRFSPNFVTTLMVKPLKYFFTSYAGPDLAYDDDMNKTKIEIGSVNDFNKIPYGQKPRILIDRGPYTIKPVGLSDNLAEEPSVFDRKGLKDKKNMSLISGNSAILIMARQEGVCELVADMVSHFFFWTAPMICDSQNFKQFATPLNITPCIPDKEDTEVFKVNISVPWVMEEMWQVRSDSLLIKNFTLVLETM